MTALTAKQQRFVDEYLVDLNGKQAAIRTGYSAKTAEVQASRLLSDAKVRAAVEAKQAARSKRTGVSQDWVLRKLVSNVRRAMQAEQVKDAKGVPTGEYTYQGAVANGALSLLGKHLGMFTDKVEHTGKDGAPLLAPEQREARVLSLLTTAKKRKQANG